MSKTSIQYLIGAAILLLGLGLGFAVCKITDSNKKPTGDSGEFVKNKFYTSQSALIRGKVTEVKGNMLSVVNSYNVAGTVKLSQTLYINKASPGAKLAPPSSDIKDLELNKDVLITLETINNELQVTMVQFVPNIPPIAQPTGLQLPKSINPSTPSPTK